MKYNVAARISPSAYLEWLDVAVRIIISVLVFIVGTWLTIEIVEGHNELRNDMPVVPNALTFCFMRYDSKDSGGEKDTYLECNMVEGFTQEQLKTMREHLEEYAKEK